MKVGGNTGTKPFYFQQLVHPEAINNGCNSYNDKDADQDKPPGLIFSERSIPVSHRECRKSSGGLPADHNSTGCFGYLPTTLNELILLTGKPPCFLSSNGKFIRLRDLWLNMLNPFSVPIQIIESLI